MLIERVWNICLDEQLHTAYDAKISYMRQISGTENL
jgi:hypothetical protein